MEDTRGQMRDLIGKLFRDAGYELPELLDYIDKLEKDNAALSENARKWRLEAARRSGPGTGMNSRLRDALRE